MSDGTHIEWTDATVNVVNGCSVVSPGCTNCYAMRLAGTRMRHHPSRQGLTVPSKAGPVWNGTVRFNEAALLQPLSWKRPRKIFWNAHGDLFHEAVPDEWIDRCFAVMALTPQHIHQVLTKRPERMRDYFAASGAAVRWAYIACQLRDDGKLSKSPMFQIKDPLPNVWLGVSVEDQTRANERIPALLDTPAAVRWLSMEPLLGAVDLSAWMPAVHHHPDNVGRNSPPMQSLIKAARDRLGGGVDWIVLGGESGAGSRPMNPQWARDVRDQCANAGVPFLFKQWGDWVSVSEVEGPQTDWHSFDDWRTVRRVGKKRAGRLLDGVQHDGYPA